MKVGFLNFFCDNSWQMNRTPLGNDDLTDAWIAWVWHSAPLPLVETGGVTQVRN